MPEKNEEEPTHNFESYLKIPYNKMDYLTYLYSGLCKLSG
jgi:hypothetical protein